MPKLRKLKLQALADLLSQLRYAPQETRLRQMRSAEQLAEEIVAEQEYPHEYIVFRLTGYRPDAGEPGDLIYQGAEVLAELAILIERLCDTLRLTPDDLGGVVRTMPQLREHWAVSERTINRYRQLGLIGHRAVIEGRTRLVFTETQTDRFARLHAEALAKARSFTRLEPALEERLIKRARRYRQVLGWSLNQTAEQLSHRFGRGQETIRQLLLRHDQQAGAQAIFQEQGPLTTRQRQVIHRAWRLGLPIDLLGRRFERNRSSIHRTINEQRAALLRALSLAGPTAATFQRDDADSVFLAPEVVRTGLAHDFPATAASLSQFAAEHDLPEEATEQAWCAAFLFLRYRCRLAIEALPQHQPSAVDLDRIETDLRWVSRLKRALIVSHLRLAVQTIERFVDRALVQLPAGQAPPFFALAVRALAEAVDMHDVFKGGRLAAPASLRLTKHLATSAAPPPESLARAKHEPGTIQLPELRTALDPWQAWLELSPHLWERLEGLSASQRSLLRQRYAFSAQPPRTLSETAEALELSPLRAARLEREAIRALHKAAPR